MEPTQNQQLKMGTIPIDVVRFAEAVEQVTQLVRDGKGGYVVTPNVDHVILAEDNEEFRNAYADASLSVVDGMPLVWASRILGTPLPEKISGSDLAIPVIEQAGKEKFRIFLLGASPEVAAKAKAVMEEKYGVTVVGHDSPRFSASPQRSEVEASLQKIRETKPHLILVAMGAPKQELFMHKFQKEYAPAVALGIGATLDFIAGALPRAPKWMSDNGLEWAYRLSREPKRLWKRYLVNDPKFVFVLMRMLTQPKSERVSFRAR